MKEAVKTDVSLSSKSKRIKKQPPQFSVHKRFLGYCREAVCSPYTHTILIVSCLIVTIISLRILYRFNAELDRRITEEAERNAANLALMEDRLLERTEAAEQNLLAALDGSALETRRAIRSLDANIQGLLDAQRRRTMESFYREDAIAVERREAAAAFTAGRYVTASRMYGEIAAAHQDDQEARFYQYYALFLSNRQDRDNYRLIAEAMTLLERQGYTRRELTETLAFIAAETGTAETNGEAP